MDKEIESCVKKCIECIHQPHQGNPSQNWAAMYVSSHRLCGTPRREDVFVDSSRLLKMVGYFM